MKLFTPLFSLVFALLLTGCGGGGGSSDSPASTSNLTGTAAVGAALDGATITVQGSGGNSASATASSSGTFSVNVSALSAPYILKAVDLNLGIELYSYAESASNVNITPVTSLIMSQALSSTQTLQDLFDNFQSTNFTQFESSLNTQISAMNGMVSDSDFSGFDHFNGEFSADSTGYDGALDNLNFTYYGASVTLLDENFAPLVVTNEVSVSGRVLDDSNAAITTGTVSITATNSTSGAVSTTTADANGEFSLPLLREQSFNIEVSATGYQSVTINTVSTDSDSSNISLSTVILTTETAAVDYSATIIDATSDDSVIADATIKIRAGQNTQSGAVTATTSSDVGGSFSFTDLTPGSYTLELSKTGYHTQFENISINSGTAAGQLFMVPQTTPPEDEPTATTPVVTSMTITLQWSDSPEDLDAHLTGPKAGTSSRFHINVNEQCWADTELNDSASCDSNPTAILDRDEVDGYGPETITLSEMTDGNYHFYVHHADYYLSSDEGSISGSSNAVVKVIDNFGRTFTFNAPISGGSGANDIWHVFTTDENGTPMSVNRIDANSSDTTAELE